MKKEDLEKRKNNLRSLKILMIVLDIFFIPLLYLQIKLDMVNIPSYVILIICNIVVFLARIKEK